jgi:dTDP-4-dehydrorhamnose reductase
MAFKKILLIGSTGQLGFEIKSRIKHLYKIISPKRNFFDLEYPAKLRVKINKIKPDLIINAAAYTEVDLAEKHKRKAYLINSKSLEVLAKESNKLNIPLIHYSTDYVFDGKQFKKYREEDKTNPLNIYGKSKLKGEKAIKKYHDKFLIFRTSWLYSKRSKNFYSKIIELFKRKKNVSIVDDQFGTPTTAKFVAKQTVKIILKLKQDLNKEKRWGLYHISENKVMSWYEFAKKIYSKEKNKKNFKVKKILPIRTSEYPFLAKRPKYSALSSKKIKSIFSLNF